MTFLFFAIGYFLGVFHYAITRYIKLKKSENKDK